MITQYDACHCPSTKIKMKVKSIHKDNFHWFGCITIVSSIIMIFYWIINNLFISWYDMIWYGMVWYSMVWYGMASSMGIWWRFSGMLKVNILCSCLLPCSWSENSVSEWVSLFQLVNDYPTEFTLWCIFTVIDIGTENSTEQNFSELKSVNLKGQKNSTKQQNWTEYNTNYWFDSFYSFVTFHRFSFSFIISILISIRPLTCMY